MEMDKELIALALLETGSHVGVPRFPFGATYSGSR
jgi:hypothetical protein